MDAEDTALFNSPGFRRVAREIAAAATPQSVPSHKDLTGHYRADCPGPPDCTALGHKELGRVLSPVQPDYQAGSRLLKRVLDRAVAIEGLTFTEANDVFTDALPGVLRAAVNLRREQQHLEATP